MEWSPIGSILVLAALAGATWPQEKAKTEAAPPAQEAAKTPEQRLAVLVERFNAQKQEVYEAYQEADTEEERAKILRGLPGKEYLPEFRAVAEEAKGTDTAVGAWLWVLRLCEGDKPEWTRIVQLLLEEHMESPALAELPGELRYASHQYGEEPVLQALRAMVDGSTHETVQADALFTLGAVLLDSKSDAKRAEGRKCFERVAAEFGQLAYSGSTYGEAAQGYLFELDHLQIGMVAPDFETKDENGVPWKLSDYKGKVVVIDFWGNW